MKELNIVYVYFMPLFVEVSIVPVKENGEPFHMWEGHWENYLDYNRGVHPRALSKGAEGILTLLTSDCGRVSLPY